MNLQNVSQVSTGRSCLHRVPPACPYHPARCQRSRPRQSAPARAVDNTASESSTSSSPQAPWAFGFQMNERYLQWGDGAAYKLVVMHLAEQLKLSGQEVEMHLAELSMLIPDMAARMGRTRADILLALIKDVKATAARLLRFRELLPGVNVSELVSRCPQLLVDWDGDSLAARLNHMRQELPGVRVEVLVDREPMILKVDIQAVLANVRRILPSHNPVDVLVNTPQMVLDMNSAGMESAVDVEGYVPREKKQ